jgi:2-polyprenyl-3-methyl-5-hydroxy-6-metoxy-1,4-benzoquinol methylase
LHIIDESYTYEDFLKRVNKKRKFHNFRKRQLLKYLRDNFRPGLRLLDVGTSDGSFLKAMKDEGFEVLGVDPESKFSEFCEGYFQIKIIPKFLEEANFTNKSFDVVTVFGVLEHIYDPHKFIQSVFDLLKESGFLYMAIPSVFSVHSYSIAKGHTCLYSKHTLTQALESNGFRVLNIDEPGLGNVYYDRIEVFATKNEKPLNYKFYAKDKLSSLKRYLKWSIFRGHFEWHYFNIYYFIKNRILKIVR